MEVDIAMLIGVPREIKADENRVAVTAAGVHDFVQAGHQVIIEKSAGAASGIPDSEYIAAGARISETAAGAWTADMIIKVKEPLPAEYDFLRAGQILFTYLHLAREPELTRVLLAKKVVAIAYETIQLADGSLPLLLPMSEVAGRMAGQIGARFLEKISGGKGLLLGGVPGVSPAQVTIIGGGTVGTNAARIALGMGADVTVLEKNGQRLRELDDLFGGHVKTLMSNTLNIASSVARTDLLVGAVLIPGARAPRLVSEEMVKTMAPGSVIVDVAIDQGGCIETIDRVTTHSDPIYIKHGILHYSVANMPGAVARTSTYALTNMTWRYALELVDKGYRQAIQDNPALGKGLNTVNGYLTCQAVAQSLNLTYIPLAEII
jgi:alanine dehydrogenase